MFVHSVIESIKNKQPTVAKNNLFALKKYVPRNNSPHLPVARNIISQISIVQQYEQEKITRMIVILKNAKQILVIFLLNSTKTTTTGTEKSRQIFTHPTIHMHESQVRTNFRNVHRPSYRSSKGRISDVSWQLKSVSKLK